MPCAQVNEDPKLAHREQSTNDGGLADMTFYCGLLGPLVIAIDDNEVVLATTMLRATLAALLFGYGRFSTHSQLATALWESPPRSAQSNLRTYVAKLRQ